MQGFSAIGIYTPVILTLDHFKKEKIKGSGCKTFLNDGIVCKNKQLFYSGPKLKLKQS